MLLPTPNGKLEDYQLVGNPLQIIKPAKPFTRTAFAAAHVITDTIAERDPWQGRPAVDWDATIGFRHFLWDQGLGLAEAMDTAQRGMGVDWLTAKELIERTMRDAKSHPMKPRVACGAGTDQLPMDITHSEDDIINAYLEQMEAIEAAGGQVIIMASRSVAKLGGDAQSYLRIYEKLLGAANQPVILHWLGDMFDPLLKGYWGSSELDEATETVSSILNQFENKIDGIKISLLEQKREEDFRKRVPKGVKIYTGDDFNYADLIAGDADHYSHALLGIFAAIAPAASQALVALSDNDLETYHKLLSPTVPLSREIFRAPTQFYKAGIAFLAWLNGAQSHFVMPGGFHSSRDITHYAQLFRLADQARLLLDPDRAQSRMKNLLSLYGVE